VRSHPTIFLLLLLAASVSFGLVGCKRQASVQPSTGPQSALAEVTAEEVARLAGPGGKVFVLAPASGDPAGMAIDPVLKPFAAALVKHGNVTVSATERVKARVNDPSPTREELTAAQFDGFMRGTKGATAIVSFVGFPVLDDAQIAGLKSRSIKLVAIYTAGPQAGPHYKKTLMANALDLAILPRMDPPPGVPQNPPATRDTFNRQYLLATPETAARLQF
jgi:hypothetical protein